MKAKDIFYLVAAPLLLVAFGFAIYGWVQNIISLANASGFSGMVVLRAVGVLLAPLGAVLGFI